MMALQADLGLAYDDLSRLIHSMVDVVIQVERRNGRRFISDVKLFSNERIVDFSSL